MYFSPWFPHCPSWIVIIFRGSLRQCNLKVLIVTRVTWTVTPTMKLWKIGQNDNRCFHWYICTPSLQLRRRATLVSCHLRTDCSWIVCSPWWWAFLKGRRTRSTAKAAVAEMDVPVSWDPEIKRMLSLGGEKPAKWSVPQPSESPWIRLGPDPISCGCHW